MRLSDFDFHLPDRLTATEPANPRDSARLLHIGKSLSDRYVRDLPQLLRPGDVMVFNDSKVIPARLYGVKHNGGGAKIECLLHKALDDALWEVWLKPAKKVLPGDTLVFADDFSAQIIEKTPEGPVHLRFDREGAALFEALHRYGLPPLPPYIKRPAESADIENYQTIYAKHDGSVAAPTAGLHFTPDLLAQIDAMGVTRVHVTLHVGAGTFKPVQTENIRDHIMHAEWGEVSENTAALINEAKAEKRRIVAVGTTSTRLLETAWANDGRLNAWCGETDIFITPGYEFRCVDALMTNFHLPKSTLLMLVSAFAGMERVRDAYAHAIENGYRFYSYGDSCFFEPKDSKI